MNICVAGLGLIGGSMCLSLKRAGRKVYGWNRSQNPLSYALANKIIDGAVKDFSSFDVVFVALPPEASISFILNTPFKEGAVVADICGVKKCVEDAVYGARRDIKYIGTHPMAGKEVSGVENACEDLFDRASMVITRGIYTDERALNAVKSLVKDMGFARIVECSAEYHDRKIAYTSQLAHVVSNAYVKDKESFGCFGFTGGSFQDMTRIAGVDETVWSSLYLLNKDNLLNNLSQIIRNLEEIKTVLADGDGAELEAALRRGRETFESSCLTDGNDDGVVITNLK